MRFVNERPIFDAVYHAVKSALNTEDAPKVMELKSSGVQPYAPVLERQEQMKLPVPGEAPQTPTNAPPKMREAAVLRDSVQGRDTFHSFAQRVLEPEPEKAAFTPVEESSILLSASQKEPSFSESVEEALPSLKEKSAVPQEAPKQLLGEFHSRILGEAFGTYILVEYSREELMFIDKHAAHERLLYEKLKQQGQSGEAQALLEPVPVTLDKEEYSAVLARQEELLSAGFEVEDFGRGTARRSIFR